MIPDYNQRTSRSARREERKRIKHTCASSRPQHDDLVQRLQPGMISDRIIPWYFVAFFVGLTIVLTAMTIIALRTETGVVTKHPYEQGLAYNKIIAAEENQEALDWHGKITFLQKTEKSGILLFDINDISGNIVALDKVSADITRPAKQGMDFKIELPHDETGKFAAEVEFPTNGLWEIRVYANKGSDKYQIAKRIVLE